MKPSISIQHLASFSLFLSLPAFSVSNHRSHTRSFHVISGNKVAPNKARGTSFDLWPYFVIGSRRVTQRRHRNIYRNSNMRHHFPVTFCQSARKCVFVCWSTQQLCEILLQRLMVCVKSHTLTIYIRDTSDTRFSGAIVSSLFVCKQLKDHQLLIHKCL